MIRPLVLSLGLLLLAPAPARAQFADLRTANGRPVALDGDVLELAGPVLEQVARGLTAQARFHDSLTTVVARGEATLDAFDECMSGALTGDSPLQLVTDSLMATSDDDPAHARLEAQRLALAGKACGAAGARLDVLRDDVWRVAPSRGQAASGLTARQYRIAAERVVAFCKLRREPGDDALAAYVFSAKEQAALAPRCAAMAQTLASID